MVQLQNMGREKRILLTYAVCAFLVCLFSESFLWVSAQNVVENNPPRYSQAVSDIESIYHDIPLSLGVSPRSVDVPMPILDSNTGVDNEGLDKNDEDLIAILHPKDDSVLLNMDSLIPPANLSPKQILIWKRSHVDRLLTISRELRLRYEMEISKEPLSSLSSFVSTTLKSPVISSSKILSEKATPEEIGSKLIRALANAAHLGSINATTALGELYLMGEVVAPHYELARDLFQIGADQGDADAHVWLGFMYSNGLADPYDLNKINSNLLNRTDKPQHPHSHAQSEQSSTSINHPLFNSDVEFPPVDSRSSLLSPNRDLVRKRLDLALTHWYAAAFAGSNDAKLILGSKHISGDGVPRSCSTAIQYYAEVAEHVIRNEKPEFKPLKSLRAADQPARLITDRNGGGGGGFLYASGPPPKFLQSDTSLVDVVEFHIQKLEGTRVYDLISDYLSTSASVSFLSNEEKNLQGGILSFLKGVASRFLPVNGNNADVTHQGLADMETHAADDSVTALLRVWGDPSASQSFANAFQISVNEIETLYFLGIVYYYGSRDLPVNRPLALRCLRIAADAGHIDSLGTLVTHYIRTGRVPRRHDVEALLKLWKEITTGDVEKAVASGKIELSAPAIVALGLLFKHGYESDTNEHFIDKAASPFGLSASQNIARELLRSNPRISHDSEQEPVLVEKHIASALLCFRLAALMKDPSGKFHLANLSLSSVNIDLDDVRGWYVDAARAGHLPAMHNLAQLHLHGMGTAQACDIASPLFRLIGESGRTPKWLLEKAYFLLTKQKNRHASMMHYALAAEMGIEVAQANLGALLSPSSKSYLTTLFDMSTSHLLSSVLGSSSAQDQVSKDARAYILKALPTLSYLLKSERSVGIMPLTDVKRQVRMNDGETTVFSIVDVSEYQSSAISWGDSYSTLAIKDPLREAATRLALTQAAYERASVQGNIIATRQLGDFAFYGHSTRMIPFKVPDDLVNDKAQKQLGDQEDIEDMSLESKVIKACKEQGHPWILLSGLPDFALAAEYYKLGMKYQDTQSQYNLARLEELGLKKSSQELLELGLQAIEIARIAADSSSSLLSYSIQNIGEAVDRMIDLSISFFDQNASDNSSSIPESALLSDVVMTPSYDSALALYEECERKKPELWGPIKFAIARLWVKSKWTRLRSILADVTVESVKSGIINSTSRMIDSLSNIFNNARNTFSVNPPTPTAHNVKELPIRREESQKLGVRLSLDRVLDRFENEILMALSFIFVTLVFLYTLRM